MTTERRTSVRAPVSLLAGVETGGGEEAVVVLDLSTSGARIQMAAEPDPTREYEISFTVHETRYEARFRIVRCEVEGQTFTCGCSFVDMTPQHSELLGRVVNAAAGLSTLVIRPWSEIVQDAYVRRADQIVVGSTPAGQEIRLLGSDCLEIGEEGVELFVRTVASLEHA